MYNIGVIGDYESICGFSAIGFSIFPVESVEQAKKELKTLAGSKFGIIYITEPLMEQMKSDCAVYDDTATPCIVPLPTHTDATGFAKTRLKHCVERAIGSDIIFGNT